MNHLRAALAFVVPLAIAVTASAVLIDGADGARDVSPFPVAELDNIGVRGGCSAIYLGNGVVLTASHVGAGDVTFGGISYSYVPGSAVQLRNGDGTYADLLMFEIYPQPDLPALVISPQTPPYRALLLVVGNGLDRAEPLVWDPNGNSAPGPTDGYAWGDATNLRWGTNNVEVFPAGGRIFNTQAFGSFFDPGKMLPEAQAVTGDSGGGVFTLSPLGWQLSGVILGIIQYSGQPANTSFFGQRTYYADLAYYRPQLTSAVDLPEPDRALAPGAALVAVLATARRARRSRQPLQPVRSRRWATAARSVLSPPIG